LSFSTGCQRLCLALALAAAILIGSLAEAQSVALSGSHAPAAASLTARVAASHLLEMRIILSLRDEAALDRLLAQLHDPAAPQFHRWLTPAEFNARFAPRQAGFDAVQDWLKSEGVTITSADREGRYIDFTVPAGEAERLFNVTIAASADGRNYANLTDPSIPAHLAGVIAQVDGLDNLRRAVPMARRLGPQSISGSAASGTPWYLYDGYEGFGPADMRTFYDESDALDGHGQCIGLVEDSDWIDSAVTLFDQQFNLKTGPVSRVLAGGINPGINGDETETLLDIQWAHAIAPAAALRVYLGPRMGNILASITQAVRDNRCAAIDISFGYCGTSPTFYSKTLDSLFKQAAAQGISVFVASGDDGVDNCLNMTPNVSEMAADPNVTGVGGTMFIPNYDGNGDDVGFVPEQVWNEPGGGASGGGASKIFTKPAFQESNLTPNDGRRDVPDVAMIAGSPAVYLGNDDRTGGHHAFLDCCWGGTSLGAPMFAGIAALINQNQGGRIGNADWGLYQLGPNQNNSTVGLRDVTSGDNHFNGVAGFSAGPGYDQATGWGTPDIDQLVAAWKSAVKPPPVPVTLGVRPRKLGLGRAVFGASGATTRARIVTITNPARRAGMTVTLTSIETDQPALFSVSTSFANGCGTTLPPAHSCRIAVRYTPSAQTTQTGNLVILDNTVAGQTVVPLHGVGIAGAIGLWPGRLVFPRQQQSTISRQPQIVTVANPNPVDLMISSVTVNGDFKKVSDGCTGVLKSKKEGGPNRCQVAVAFSPTATGPRQGTLVFVDDAAKGSQTVHLAGIGK